MTIEDRNAILKPYLDNPAVIPPPDHFMLAYIFVGLESGPMRESILTMKREMEARGHKPPPLPSDFHTNKAWDENGPTADWAGSIFRKEKDSGPWIIFGRIRVHVDNKAFNSKDKKTFMANVIEGNDADAFRFLDETLDGLRGAFPVQDKKVTLVNGSPAEFIKMIQDGKVENIHMRSYVKGTPEYEEMLKERGMTEEELDRQSHLVDDDVNCWKTL